MIEEKKGTFEELQEIQMLIRKESSLRELCKKYKNNNINIYSCSNNESNNIKNRRRKQ